MLSLCMLCSYVHMLMCLFRYVHMSMLCPWVCMLMYTCTHECVHIYSHVMLCSFVQIFICVFMYVHMCMICSYLCMLAMLMCAYAHMHTCSVYVFMYVFMGVYTHGLHVCACSWIQVLMHVICMCAYTCLFHDSVCTQLTKPSPMPPFQRFLDSGLHFWALPGYWSHPCALTRSWHSLHFCTWSAESSLGGGGSDGRSLHVSGSPRLSKIPLPQIFFKPAVWCHIGFAEPVSVSDLKTLWQQQWYLKGHERADHLPGRKPWDFT